MFPIESEVSLELDRLRREVSRLKQEKTELEELLEMNKEHAELFQEDLLSKIELSLRESERRFRLISETIPVPVIVCRESESGIVYANEPSGDLFGLSVETLLFSELCHFFELDEGRRLLDVLREQRRFRNYELQGRRTDDLPF